MGSASGILRRVVPAAREGEDGGEQERQDNPETDAHDRHPSRAKSGFGRGETREDALLMMPIAAAAGLLADLAVSAQTIADIKEILARNIEDLEAKPLDRTSQSAFGQSYWGGQLGHHTSIAERHVVRGDQRPGGRPRRLPRERGVGLRSTSRRPTAAWAGR